MKARQVPNNEIDDTSGYATNLPGRRLRVARLLRLAAGIAILIALFQLVPAKQVLSQMARAQPWWLGAGFLFALLLQYPVSARLQMLSRIQGLSLSTINIIQINLATRFYGLVLPGGLLATIAVKSFKLGNAERGYVGAVTAVTFDRILATLTLCVVGIVFWILDWPTNSTVWLAVIVAALFSLTVLIGLAGKLSSIKEADLSTSRIRFIANRIARIRQAVAQANDMSPTKVIWAIALSVIAHLCGMAAFFCIATSLNLEIDPLAIGWIRAVMILTAMIPVSLSGLGLREAAALLTLTACGIGAEAALAFSLLVTAVSVIGLGLVGGLIEAIRVVLHRQQP